MSSINSLNFAFLNTGTLSSPESVTAYEKDGRQIIIEFAYSDLSSQYTVRATIEGRLYKIYENPNQIDTISAEDLSVYKKRYAEHKFSAVGDMLIF
jgi:hypothetical protein